MSDLDDAIDALYALPLDEFTPARNALATRLKKEGDKAGAERVKQLGKPTVSAWVVNQLYRERGDELDALVEAGDEMREAQRSALRGDGGDELRQASRAQREAQSRLLRSAAQILEAAGHAASDATLDRVGVSLQALSAGGWGETEPGRLERDLEPPGFDALAGLLSGAPANVTRLPAKTKKKKPQPAGGERRAEAAQVEVDYEEERADEAAEQRAREQRAEAEALVEQARKRAKKLERDAQDADQARARADERARALREEAKEAYRRAQELQERADAAADKARAAADEAKEAARSAAQAGRDVEAAEAALRKL